MSFRSSQRSTTPALALAAGWVIGILGFGTALIGVYLALAPEDGMLTIFTQTWAVRTLRDIWPQALLIGGGIIIIAGMSLTLLADRGRPGNAAPTIAALVLAVCGAIAVGAGILVVA